MSSILACFCSSHLVWCLTFPGHRNKSSVCSLFVGDRNTLRTMHTCLVAGIISAPTGAPSTARRLVATPLCLLFHRKGSEWYPNSRQDFTRCHSVSLSFAILVLSCQMSRTWRAFFGSSANACSPARQNTCFILTHTHIPSSSKADHNNCFTLLPLGCFWLVAVSRCNR